jgi:hypothetical protein
MNSGELFGVISTIYVPVLVVWASLHGTVNMYVFIVA